MDDPLTIRLTVNAEPVELRVPPRTSLVDALRGELGLTGSHVGCEHGVCGACSVMVDGRLVRGCLMLAAQVEGAEVTTIEGVSESGIQSDLQDAFVAHNALQCGFCTPGMVLTAAALLEECPSPTRDEVRAFLSGNYCRCTGYEAIVDAVLATAARRRDGEAAR